MPHVRVLLAEDHPQMRVAIASLLSRCCHVVGTADRGDEVLSLTGTLHPEVVILDISLPGRGGMQVLPELRRDHPELTIIMLTNQDQPVFREEATRRGANGYVLKDRASDELWLAIQAAVVARNPGRIRHSKLA